MGADGKPKRKGDKSFDAALDVNTLRREFDIQLLKLHSGLESTLKEARAAINESWQEPLLRAKTIDERNLLANRMEALEAVLNKDRDGLKNYIASCKQK